MIDRWSGPAEMRVKGKQKTGALEKNNGFTNPIANLYDDPSVFPDDCRF